MASLSVRIGEKAHESLRRLAAESKESMTEVLGKAIEEYRRNHFMDRVNEAYAALRADPEAWAQEQEERALWDATLRDGLENEGPLEES